MPDAIIAVPPKAAPWITAGCQIAVILLGTLATEYPAQPAFPAIRVLIETLGESLGLLPVPAAKPAP